MAAGWCLKGERLTAHFDAEIQDLVATGSRFLPAARALPVLTTMPRCCSAHKALRLVPKSQAETVVEFEPCQQTSGLSLSRYDSGPCIMVQSIAEGIVPTPRTMRSWYHALAWYVGFAMILRFLPGCQTNTIWGLYTPDFRNPQVRTRSTFTLRFLR